VRRAATLPQYSDYATGWAIWGLSPGMVKRVFSFPKRPDNLWIRPSPLFSGYWDSFPGLKRPGCEVDHSPLSTAGVKNEWRYSPASPVCLNGVDRGNSSFFTF
jgi:hypothetical protein